MGECGSFVVEFAPHRITIDLDAAQQGTLIINQNYHPDWRTDDGVLHEWNGLLAVDVSPGQDQVVLRYFSRSFGLGLGISVVCLLGVLTIVVCHRRGYLERWSGSPHTWLRIPARALGALIV